MCDLDGVSAGSRTRPGNLLESRLTDTSTSLVGHTERKPPHSPATSSSSSREDVSKNDPMVHDELSRRWSDSSSLLKGKNPRDDGRPMIIVTPRSPRSNTNDGVGLAPRSQSMNYPQRPRIQIKRSRTIELANAWASDTELESGLESDTSNPRISPNPSQECVKLRSDSIDGPGNGQHDVLEPSPSDLSSMSKCLPVPAISVEARSFVTQGPASVELEAYRSYRERHVELPAQDQAISEEKRGSEQEKATGESVEGDVQQRITVSSSEVVISFQKHSPYFRMHLTHYSPVKRHD